MDPREVPPPAALDPVQEASEESFPASDPPARTAVTGVGGPDRGRGPETPDRGEPPAVAVSPPEP